MYVAICLSSRRGFFGGLVYKIRNHFSQVFRYNFFIPDINTCMTLRILLNTYYLLSSVLYVLQMHLLKKNSSKSPKVQILFPFYSCEVDNQRGLQYDKFTHPEKVCQDIKIWFSYRWHTAFFQINVIFHLYSFIANFMLITSNI